MNNSSEGRRSTGGQRKRYKDSLKSSLKAFEESWVLWTNQDTPGRRKETAPQIRCCGNRLCDYHCSSMSELQQNFSCPNRPYQPHPDTSPTCDRPVMSWSSSPTDGWTRDIQFFGLLKALYILPLLPVKLNVISTYLWPWPVDQKFEMTAQDLSPGSIVWKSNALAIHRTLLNIVWLKHYTEKLYILIVVLSS